MSDISNYPLNFRTIWISDAHLGTPGARVDDLLHFLKHTQSETLYLVGDIIDGWLHLVDVKLKSKLEEYGVKVHFACANEDETRVYDMFEIEDPSRVEAFLIDEEVIKLRTEAGVILDSADELSTVVKSKVW